MYVLANTEMVLHMLGGRRQRLVVGTVHLFWNPQVLRNCEMREGTGDEA